MENAKPKILNFSQYNLTVAKHTLPLHNSLFKDFRVALRAAKLYDSKNIWLKTIHKVLTLQYCFLRWSGESGYLPGAHPGTIVDIY